MNDKDQEDDVDANFPPLSSNGEEPAQDDGQFVNDCLSTLNKFDKLGRFGRVVIDRQKLTRNTKWGLVFRADLSFGGQSKPGRVDRFICWKGADGHMAQMFAIGQDVEPLA